ncbi:MAG TPA: STAS domain-containing protein, partial [Anaerolineales bacterium]|nr:STAS domain-containing protein [Anaerolineales bacterium]
LQYSELDNGVRLIKLSGALDMNGTYAIEVEFVRHCAGENVHVLVDLSKVNYISSIGIPMLVNSAKSVVRHGGRMALLSPQESVQSILELAGVPLIIPTYTDLASATTALAA